MNLENHIPSRIFANEEENSHKPFLYLINAEGNETVYSYGETVSEAKNWAAHFSSLSLSAGATIIICLPHSLDLYSAYLGAVLAGFIPTMFSTPSPKLSHSQYKEIIGSQLKSVSAQLLVASPEIQEQLCSLTTLPVLTPANRNSELAFSPYTPNSEQAAFLQYSSGTTGKKKGVGITHHALLWQIDSYANAIEINEKDVIVSWLPLYHDMGLIACYWMPFLLNIPLVAMSSFDWVKRPRMLFEAISKFRGTLSWLPNFSYHHLLRSISESQKEGLDLSCIRGLTNCSEPVLKNTHELFLQHFSNCGIQKKALWTCYALAEATFAVTVAGPKHPVDCEDFDGKTVMSSGKTLEGCQVKICREDGEECEDKELGEIIIQAPCLVSGYWKNDDPIHKKSFADGRYYTGDLGFKLGEELFVTGRKSDLIIINGKNIYPQDVETLVNSCEGVIPGRAVALGRENEGLGTEELIILVETHLLEEEKFPLMKEIQNTVVRAMELTPKDIVLLPHRTLKKSSSGKLARKANLELYLNLQGQKTEKQKKKSYSQVDEKKIVEILYEVLTPSEQRSIHNLHEDDPLISSGIIDSLNLIHFILNLEKEFSLKFSRDQQMEVNNFDTLTAIKKLINNKREESQELSGKEEKLSSSSTRNTKCLNFIESPEKYDLLILGSSRVNGLSSKVAKEFGYCSYNFSVNTALAEDWWSIANFAIERSKGKLLHIVLGLDVFAFSNKITPMARLLASPFLKSYLDKEDNSFVGRYYSESNVDKKQDGWDTEDKDRYNAILMTLTQKNFEEKLGREYHPSTGDMIFSGGDNVLKTYNQRNPMKLLDKTVSVAQEELYLRGFSALEPKRMEYFLRFLLLCESNNIELTCFLPSLHPVLLEFYFQRDNYLNRLRELMQFMNEHCNSLLTFYDYTNPRRFGADHDDFIDLGHLSGHASDLLFRDLLKKIGSKNV
jgi:fatty-acyl-CoA synthase